LGPRARVQAKPQLEIFADNVKCSHGSATGKPDEDALFYMQSRGIPKNTALQLWSKGFIAEIIKDIPNPAIQSYVESRI
jgi:Fe-S cluster assembly protein SufD